MCSVVRECTTKGGTGNACGCGTGDMRPCAARHDDVGCEPVSATPSGMERLSRPAVPSSASSARWWSFVLPAAARSTADKPSSPTVAAASCACDGRAAARRETKWCSPAAAAAAMGGRYVSTSPPTARQAASPSGTTRRRSRTAPAGARGTHTSSDPHPRAAADSTASVPPSPPCTHAAHGSGFSALSARNGAGVRAAGGITRLPTSRASTLAHAPVPAASASARATNVTCAGGCAVKSSRSGGVPVAVGGVPAAAGGAAAAAPPPPPPPVSPPPAPLPPPELLSLSSNAAATMSAADAEASAASTAPSAAVAAICRSNGEMALTRFCTST